MAKRNSSSAQAILGLLTISPMSGYELGQTIRLSIGHIWSESYGQIYPNLKKLAADKSVVCKLEKQKGKPDRTIYSITEKGREQLATWLATPPQPEIPRNEMLLKLFFGEQTSPALLIGYVQRMVEEHTALLQKFAAVQLELDGPQQYPGAPYWRMAAQYGVLEMKAHLEWAEETLAQLRTIERKKETQ